MEGRKALRVPGDGRRIHTRSLKPWRRGTVHSADQVYEPRTSGGLGG